jgi:acyl transferase domain-containing protein
MNTYHRIVSTSARKKPFSSDTIILNNFRWMGDGLGHLNVEKGSFLKDIDLFDHVEFGISSRDARAMAPSTRKLLEQCFLALLDSGIDFRKQPVGCYTSANSVEVSTASSQVSN